MLEGLAAGEVVEPLSHVIDVELPVEAIALSDGDGDQLSSRAGSAHRVVVVDGGGFDLVPGGPKRFDVSPSAPWSGLVGLVLKVS